MITIKHQGVSDEVIQSISRIINNNNFSPFAEALITIHAIRKDRRDKEILDSFELIKTAELQPSVTEGAMSFFSNSAEMDVDREIIQ